VSVLDVVTKWQIHKITLFVETKKMGKRKMCVKNDTIASKMTISFILGGCFYIKKTAHKGRLLMSK
jgi:hypothetical protein